MSETHLTATVGCRASMPFIVFALIALVGAFVSVRRHRGKPDAPLAVDTFFVWWMVTTIGVGGLIGAGYHLFDGKEIAEQIGYTRGNGGFQFENAMGDLAIAVAAILCVKFRGYFWLATVIVLSIQFFGDAGGHIYYWLADDNTKPDNVGIPLFFDIAGTLVIIGLYIASWRQGGDARPEPARAPAPAATQPSAFSAAADPETS
jgi:hypothetical protein